MIIIGVVGTGEKRHETLIKRLKKVDDSPLEVKEIGRWLGNPALSKERYYRDQIKQLKRDGFDGVAVFTNVMYHDEFLALASQGGVMWHLVSSVSDCIPIVLGTDVLVSMMDMARRPNYIQPEDALHHTINSVIER